MILEVNYSQLVSFQQRWTIDLMKRARIYSFKFVQLSLDVIGRSGDNMLLRRIRQVDTELFNFENAVRSLGSSAGLICSASDLRARLQQVLHLFRENAADLFPLVKKTQEAPMLRFLPRTLPRTNSGRERRHSLEPSSPHLQDDDLTSDPAHFPPAL